MARIPVFYSFHFDNDVMRVQMVRNMGMIDGNEPVSKNDWETVKRSGDAAIERWIDSNMSYKRCVVVLIGKETHRRPWVKYEIEKAWRDGRGLLGIHIHNLKCPVNGYGAKGRNPFAQLNFRDKGVIVPPPLVYDPPATSAYNYIRDNLAAWVEKAIEMRK